MLPCTASTKTLQTSMGTLKYAVADCCYSHQKLMDKLGDKERTKCQHFGGMKSISPGLRMHSEYLALANEGNFSKSGFSTSTWLVFSRRRSSWG